MFKRHAFARPPSTGKSDDFHVGVFRPQPDHSFDSILLGHEDIDDNCVGWSITVFFQCILAILRFRHLVPTPFED